AGLEGLSGGLPTPLPPVGNLIQGLERQLLHSHVAPQAVAADRPRFLRRVVENFPHRVAEQLGPGPGSGTAEEVEREDCDGGSHRENAIRAWTHPYTERCI